MPRNGLMKRNLATSMTLSLFLNRNVLISQYVNVCFISYLNTGWVRSILFLKKIIVNSLNETVDKTYQNFTFFVCVSSNCYNHFVFKQRYNDMQVAMATIMFISKNILCTINFSLYYHYQYNIMAYFPKNVYSNTITKLYNAFRVVWFLLPKSVKINLSTLSK